jgi:hypothetical protein
MGLLVTAAQQAKARPLVVIVCNALAGKLVRRITSAR